jgi:hypothetical protein
LLKSCVNEKRSINICDKRRKKRTTFDKLCSFFWVTPRRLNFMCRRFGTSCMFLRHRWCKLPAYLLTPPVQMEQCSETSAHKIQTPGSHPKERIQHSEQTVYLPDMDCILCCVFSVLYCSVTLYCSVLLFFFCVLYCVCL